MHDIGFYSLPVELLCTLGLYCDYERLCHLASVNRTFNAVFAPILYHRHVSDRLSPPCVHWAVAHNSLPTLKYAFAHGADLNRLDNVAKYGRGRKKIHQFTLATPLHLAIFQERLEIVRWLLEHGARPDIKSDWICMCPISGLKHHWYPEHFALFHSSNAIMHLILERDIENHILELECAIKAGSVSVVDALVQHMNFNPLYRDATGCSPLHWVAECTRTKAACAIAEKLIQRGVHPDVEPRFDHLALGDLIQQYMFEPAIVLLRYGANPELRHHSHIGSDMLFTCLGSRYALNIQMSEPSRAEEFRGTRLELLKLLVAGGMDVNRLHDHWSPTISSRPLFWALVAAKDVCCVQILLDAGARIKDALIEDGDDGAENILLGLFDTLGAETWKASKWWFMAWGIRDFEPYKESVSLLLSKGARIDSGTEQTALSRACELEKEKGTLSFLVENATRGNVELAHVAALRDRYVGDETIWQMLDGFYYKLVAEEND